MSDSEVNILSTDNIGNNHLYLLDLNGGIICIICIVLYLLDLKDGIIAESQILNTSGSTTMSPRCTQGELTDQKRLASVSANSDDDSDWDSWDDDVQEVVTMTTWCPFISSTCVTRFYRS